MRLLIIILFILHTTSSFAQIEVEFFFLNDCDNSVKRLEFELINLDNEEETHSKNGTAVIPNLGKYLLTAYQKWSSDRISVFDYVVEISNPIRHIDTLSIPKIKFTTDRVLHSKYWNYFNCDKLCNGIEKDLFPNGQKRLEGEFKEGKPIHITEYRIDGTKETEFWYISGTQFYERVNYYDESGKLDNYDKYKTGKHRTVKLTYSARGKKVGREVTKHTIEK